MKYSTFNQWGRYSCLPALSSADRNICPTINKTFAMNATALVVLVIAAAACRAAEPALEAHAAPNGTLTLYRDGKTICDLNVGLFDSAWRHADAVAAPKDFTLKTADGVEVKGAAAFTRNADGTLVAKYTFTPGADVALNSVNVSADFPIAALAGATWTMDGESGTFPAAHKDTGLHAAKIKALKLAPKNAAEFSIAFDEPTEALLQDNREWNTQTFSLRIGLKGAFKKGESVSFGFTLNLGGPIAIVKDGPVTIVAGADWIPLKTELDIEAGSALDFSGMGQTDAPAGKYGRVICSADGNFVFENEKTPRRFYGVNLCFSGQYMTQDEADKLADRLARLGYNAVRIHHYEGELTSGKKSTELNDAKAEQLDYLFAALGKRGIYITTDLFVSRPIAYKDIGIDKPGNVGMDEFKISVPAIPAAYENWKAFATTLLTHVNKYTGKRNADEPALAWLSMINEGNFGNFTAQIQKVPEWKTLWNAWLSTRYKSRDELAQAWGKELKDSEDATKGTVAPPLNVNAGHARARDENLFLVEKEREMVLKMKAFLHDELHCNALITNSNAWTNHVTDQYKREVYDYIDDHFYVDHPKFLQGDWRLPSRCDNTSPIAGGATGGRNCAFTRIFGKPFTITEFNYAGPGRFRGVGGILTGAMGALQGWSGIWRFAYCHDHGKLFTPARMDYFDMIGDPLSQAAERASLCLYLRGDMKMAPGAMLIDIKKDELHIEAEHWQSVPEKIPGLAASWHWAAWVTRIGTRMDNGEPPNFELADAPIFGLPLYWDRRGLQQMGPFAYDSNAGDVMNDLKNHHVLADGNPTDPAKNIFRSETGEITIDAPGDKMILDTPKTAGGYAKAGESIVTHDGGVSINISGADATVWISSLDKEPIAKSSRLLVTHLTDLQNTGIKYAENARKTLLDWGKLPHLVRNGKAAVRVKLTDPARFEIWALSTGGKRLGKVESQVKDGALEFTADVGVNVEAGARMLYEIVAK